MIASRLSPPALRRERRLARPARRLACRVDRRGSRTRASWRRPGPSLRRRNEYSFRAAVATDFFALSYNWLKLQGRHRTRDARWYGGAGGPGDARGREHERRASSRRGHPASMSGGPRRVMSTAHRCVRAAHSRSWRAHHRSMRLHAATSRDHRSVDRERGLWHAARSSRIRVGARVAPCPETCLVQPASCCVFRHATAATPDWSPDGGTSGTCEEAKSHSDLAWIQANIFTTSCALGACHRGTALSAGRLSLESGTAHDSSSTRYRPAPPAGCASCPATPRTAISSSRSAPSRGPLPSDGIMPLGSSVLCSEKRDAIKRWIAAGAPQ